nr:hypothetical protein [uncultured Lichenicoccus sp.]
MAGLQRMPAAFLITLLASTMLETALFFSRIDAAPAGNGIGRPAVAMLFVSFAVSFARYLVATPLAIAMHRFVLLGEAAVLLPLRPLGRVLRFAVWLTAIGAVSDTGLFLLGTLPGRVALIPVLQILGVVLAIRFILIFPELALGSTDHVAGHSWSATRRQFWRIGAVSFVTSLPVIAGVVAVVLLARLLGPLLPWLPMVQPATAILVGLLTPLCIALAAASASWLFVIYNETGMNPPVVRTLLKQAPGTRSFTTGS